MTFPDFEKPFVLHTDVSHEGLSTVLYQEKDGRLKVLGYESRTFTQAEKKYHLHAAKFEFLALKYAATETFRDYLYHGPLFWYLYRQQSCIVRTNVSQNVYCRTPMGRRIDRFQFPPQDDLLSKLMIIIKFLTWSDFMIIVNLEHYVPGLVRKSIIMKF